MDSTMSGALNKTSSEEFVNEVMASPSNTVNTTAQIHCDMIEKQKPEISRARKYSFKRGLNGDEDEDIDADEQLMKKSKTSNDGDPRFDRLIEMISNLTGQLNDTHCEMTKINNNIRNMEQKIEEVIDRKLKTEFANMEQKIGDNLSTKLRGEIKGEMTKIKLDVDSRIESITCGDRDCGVLKEVKIIRDGLSKDINHLEKDLKDLKVAKFSGDSDEIGERKLNVVIKNLLPCQNELRDTGLVVNTVDRLFVEALGLNDINVIKASRIPSPVNSNRISPIIATIETTDQKVRIMKAKSRLNKTKNFYKVYIEHDLPIAVRRNNSNLMNILKIVGGERDYKIVRGRITKNVNGVNVRK